MAPKRKKRRRSDSRGNIEVLATTSGGGTIQGTVRPGNDDALASCLGELESSMVPNLLSYNIENKPTKKNNEKATKSNSVEFVASSSGNKSALDEKLWDDSVASNPLLRASTKTKISEWDAEYNLWVSSGNYPSGLLPSLDLEITRHFKVEELSKYILASHENVKMPVFERWLIDTKIEEMVTKMTLGKKSRYSYEDPILCTNVNATTSEACKRLHNELQQAGLPTSESLDRVKELCKRTYDTIKFIKEKFLLYHPQTPFKGKQIVLEECSTELYSLAYKKKAKTIYVIKINKMHYDKLAAMFTRTHGSKLKLYSAGKPTKALHVFHHLLMVLIIRYSSLSGGQLIKQLRGGGMQGAVHGGVFNAASKLHNTSCSSKSERPTFLECFASPFNCYWTQSYCSAFEDVDIHFGSIGSIWELQQSNQNALTKGCFEVNPPFSPGLMNFMVDCFEFNMTSASHNKNAQPLTIIFIVPSAVTPDNSAVDDSNDADTTKAAKTNAVDSFNRLVNNENCVLHIKLANSEHGYVEGAQHLRPTRYKDSKYDTSVIIWQSHYIRDDDDEENEALDNIEAQIRHAFTSRHKPEIERRKTDKTAPSVS